MICLLGHTLNYESNKQTIRKHHKSFKFHFQTLYSTHTLNYIYNRHAISTLIQAINSNKRGTYVPIRNKFMNDTNVADMYLYPTYMLIFTIPII